MGLGAVVLRIPFPPSSWLGSNLAKFYYPKADPTELAADSLDTFLTVFVVRLCLPLPFSDPFQGLGPPKHLSPLMALLSSGVGWESWMSEVTRVADLPSGSCPKDT